MVIRRTPNPSPSPTHDETKLDRKEGQPSDPALSPDNLTAKLARPRAAR